MGAIQRAAVAAACGKRSGHRWLAWLSPFLVSGAVAYAALWPATAQDAQQIGSSAAHQFGAMEAVDPTVSALVDYARGLSSGGTAPRNFSPASPDHGLSQAAAEAHAGLSYATVDPRQRFETHFSGHSHNAVALALPEVADRERIDNDLKLAGAADATIPEKRLIRSHEIRLASTSRPQREPDFVAQMPAPADDGMVTTWVALENVDDSMEPPARFGFIEILGRQSDEWKPILIATQRQPKETASARAPMVAPAPGDPDGRYFVGSKPCETCHAGLFDDFQQTVMGRNIKSGKVTAQGKMECETCHGPGSAHVNGGGGREKGGIRSFRLTDSRGADVEDFNRVCLSCHEKGDQTYWTGSPHESRGLACVNCHTVMRKVSPRNQLKTALVMDTCFQCHKDRKAQAQRTSHMPIREDKITCVNCHNPHGSATEKLLREATVNDTCFQCHADKRGPFLFEHPPVRENCLNCHEPHGSNHESLLIVARQRLCQQCHTNPHNQPGLSSANLHFEVGNACQNCHTNIHGSNAPSGSRWHR